MRCELGGQVDCSDTNEAYRRFYTRANMNFSISEGNLEKTEKNDEICFFK